MFISSFSHVRLSLDNKRLLTYLLTYVNDVFFVYTLVSSLATNTNVTMRTGQASLSSQLSNRRASAFDHVCWLCEDMHYV